MFDFGKKINEGIYKKNIEVLVEKTKKDRERYYKIQEKCKRIKGKRES